MNTIKSLIIASAVFGASAAFAGDDPATEYLKDSHLISADTSSTVVDREAVDSLDSATAYLVETGLIEAPTVRVDDGVMDDAPATAISPEVKYWESPAS